MYWVEGPGMYFVSPCVLPTLEMEDFIFGAVNLSPLSSILDILKYTEVFCVSSKIKMSLKYGLWDLCRVGSVIDSFETEAFWPPLQANPSNGGNKIQKYAGIFCLAHGKFLFNLFRALSFSL